MTEGGQKNIKEKTNIEPIYGKVNEGDENKLKKHSCKNVFFSSPDFFFFFLMFFFIPQN